MIMNIEDAHERYLAYVGHHAAVRKVTVDELAEALAALDIDPRPMSYQEQAEFVLAHLHGAMSDDDTNDNIVVREPYLPSSWADR